MSPLLIPSGEEFEHCSPRPMLLPDVKDDDANAMASLFKPSPLSPLLLKLASPTRKVGAVSHYGVGWPRANSFPAKIEAAAAY